MKTAKASASKETLSPNVAFLAALRWSTLDAWHRRPKERTPATALPLSAEQHYRMIELAAQHQAARRRVSPESDLRDWLDAEEEVKSH